MSGPKGIEIRMAQLAAARAKNRNSSYEYLSQYKRLNGQLEELQSQLQNLGIKETLTWTTPEKLASIAENSFADTLNTGLTVIEMLRTKKIEAESLISQFKKEIKDFIINVPKRHRSLCDRTAILEKEWQRLKDLSTTANPANGSKQEKSMIASIVSDALRQSRPIYIELPTLDREGASRLAASEKLCDENIQLLQAAHSKIEQAINKAHIQQISDRLTQYKNTSVSLTAFMRTMVNHEPDLADKIIDRLDSMLAEVAILQDTAAWESLLSQADNIRRETDKNIRRMKYESLVLECDKQLRVLREHEYWQKEVEALIDSATSLKGDAKVGEIVAELELMLRAGSVVGLEDIRNRLELAGTNAKEAFGRDYRRRAVIDSLISMGYEIEEGQMETALVLAGKVYLRKPGERDYAVEIATNENFTIMQTSVVRFADSQEATQQQQLRDKETEDIWCQEHARLRSDLTAKGLESKFIFKIPAGEKPVRVVIDKDRVRSRRETGAAPVQKRQM